MNNLIVYPYEYIYDILIEYIYDNYNKEITNFSYINNNIYKLYEYKLKKSKDNKNINSLSPHDCKINFTEILDNNKINFTCSLDVCCEKELLNENINKIPKTYNHLLGHMCEDRILKKLTISYKNKEDIIKFIDKAKDIIKKKHVENEKSNANTIRIFYYQKDYWNLLSKSPKRPINTLYLKEGERDNLISILDNFFKEKTRDLYLSFGMPYKHVIMLYGVPGSGKTSTITAMASYFDCDIYTIPVTKELTDYRLIDAFSNINDNEDRKRIIVLEDIDCIFN